MQWNPAFLQIFRPGHLRAAQPTTQINPHPQNITVGHHLFHRLLHHAPEIVFAYDSDVAGQLATLRALSVVRSGGAAVRVATAPEGKDPDEFVRKHGADAFREVIEGAMGLLDFQMKQVLEQTKYNDLQGKVEVVSKALPFLGASDNAVEVNEHVRRLADKLEIDEGSIRSELRRWRMGQSGAVSMSPAKRKPDVKLYAAERQILRLLFEDRQYFPKLKAELLPENFQDEEHRKIAAAAWRNLENDGQLVAGDLVNELDSAAGQSLAKIMTMTVPSGKEAEQTISDCIRTILLAELQNLYENHRLKADELRQSNDERYLQELAESQRILSKISELKNPDNRVS